MDLRDLFLAAVRAVAPAALRAAPPRADAVIEQLARGDAEVTRILRRLSARERDDVSQVLDGMLRERATSSHAHHPGAGVRPRDGVRPT